MSLIGRTEEFPSTVFSLCRWPPRGQHASWPSPPEAPPSTLEGVPSPSPQVSELTGRHVPPRLAWAMPSAGTLLTPFSAPLGLLR